MEKLLTAVEIFAATRGNYCHCKPQELAACLHIERTPRKAILLCYELHNINKANGQVEQNYKIILTWRTLVSFVLVCISQMEKTSLPWVNWAHGYNINKGKDKMFPNNLKSILFQEKSCNRHGSIWENFHTAWHAPRLFQDSSPYLQWNKSIRQIMNRTWLSFVFCFPFC